MTRTSPPERTERNRRSAATSADRVRPADAVLRDDRGGGTEVCASAPVHLQPPGPGVTADPRGLTFLFADRIIIELTELSL